MSRLVLHRAETPLRGRLRVPGDKSISHRAVLLAALAEGRSRLCHLSTGEDVRHTLGAVAGCGVTVSGSSGGMVVDGGRSRLHEPRSVIDVGNSGTAIRLLCGWSAALPWLTVLQGDASVAQRPMGRVAEPLRAMGARIDGRDGGRLPPLVVRGGGLGGIDYRPPIASAQVKAAILLAGLDAEGETTVREDVPTRAHTEELLAACGADVEIEPGRVTVRRSALAPLHLDVPADPSQAAFWIVAACVVPGSDLVLENVYLGPARATFLDVLARMGAAVTVEGLDAGGRLVDIHVQSGPLAATSVAGDEIAGLIDEIPVLAVAAAWAEGTTTFADAAELRVKESDRVATVVEGLLALQIGAEPRPDGLVVHGRAGRPWSGGAVASHGDHRVAMALAVAALAATGTTTIAGWEAVATSYPTFEEDLRRCLS